MVPNVCPGTEYKRGRTFLSEGELFTFRDRREEGHCLPSEARLDSPSERRSRKGKSSPEERKASEFVISVPRTHNWHHWGTHFLSLWRLFNHKSNYLWISLAWPSFMDAPFYRVLQVAQAFFTIDSRHLQRNSFKFHSILFNKCREQI